MSRMKSYLEDELEILEQIVEIKLSREELVDFICSNPDWMKLSYYDKVKYLLSI